MNGAPSGTATPPSHERDLDASHDEGFHPDSRFWMVMAASMSSVFLSALDLSCISLALPTIIDDLGGAEDYLWVGSGVSLPAIKQRHLIVIFHSVRLLLQLHASALAEDCADSLASTALVPWTASLASIFGRKATMQASILLFLVGSAICGAAQSMPAMIAGRTVAGVGGGGILVLANIVTVDLIPLAHR